MDSLPGEVAYNAQAKLSNRAISENFTQFVLGPDYEAISEAEE